MTLGIVVSPFYACSILGSAGGKSVSTNEVNNATLSVTGDRGDGGMG
jgi:hypothetical protein